MDTCLNKVKQLSTSSSDIAVGKFALYNGKQTVLIVSIHNDDSLPYYTISFPDGRERQTVRDRLSVVSK